MDQHPSSSTTKDTLLTTTLPFLQQQLRDFLTHELYDSAELLGGLTLCQTRALATTTTTSSSRTQTHTSSCLSFHADTLGLYADALMGKKECRRALSYYEKASTHHKLIQGTSTTATSSTATAPSPLPPPPHPHPHTHLAIKEGKCHLHHLHDPAQALRALLSLPSPLRARSLPMQILLGQVYRMLGLKKDAIAAYKQAVLLNPFALEAMVALAELGVGKKEVWGVVTTPGPGSFFFATAKEEEGEEGESEEEGGGGGGGGMQQQHYQQMDKHQAEERASLAVATLPWLESFLHAHVASKAQRWQEASARFAVMECTFFTGSTHCLLHKARIQIEEDLIVDAHKTFSKALEMDPQLVEFMDYYAVLLRQKGAMAGLNALTRRLMKLDASRPEPWIAAALHADLRGEKDRCLTFIDKAVQVGPQHVLGYHVKGTLLLSMGRAEPAAAAFLQASQLHRDIYSFKGLVDAYLAQHKYKEALSSAKEALSEMGSKNAKAITLVGRVMAQIPDNREKAKKAFQKALGIEPRTPDALLALADLYVASKEYERCIELLRQSLEGIPHDFLYTKLGEVYTLNENYSEALACFHTAISANPASTAAAAGLEKLERLMRGVDQNSNLEEDEVNDDDDDAMAD